MQRPTGVTVIAILQFLGAGVLLLGGLVFMLGMGAIGALMAQRGNASGLSMGMLAGMGAVIGVVMIVFAVLYGVVGYGMWNLKNWARIVTLVFTVLGAMIQLFGLLSSLLHFHIFALIWGSFWLGIHGLVIWYLLQPNVVQAFEGGGMARAAAR
jgi:hypothetical protein